MNQLWVNSTASYQAGIMTMQDSFIEYVISAAPVENKDVCQFWDKAGVFMELTNERKSCGCVLLGHTLVIIFIMRLGCHKLTTKLT